MPDTHDLPLKPDAPDAGIAFGENAAQEEHEEKKWLNSVLLQQIMMEKYGMKWNSNWTRPFYSSKVLHTSTQQKIIEKL